MGACAADRHEDRRAAGPHLRPGVDSDHSRGGGECGNVYAVANGSFAATRPQSWFLAGENGRGVTKAFSEGKIAQMSFRLRLQGSDTVLCSHQHQGPYRCVHYEYMHMWHGPRQKGVERRVLLVVVVFTLYFHLSLFKI